MCIRSAGCSPPHRAARLKKEHHLMNTETNRSSVMNLMHEELARAQWSERLGEAQAHRRAHRLLVARRLSRRAERAAQQARLAAARV
jgi:hypothetical protein